MAKRPPNGRKMGEAFSLITNEMQESKAFQSLTASAIRVLLRCLYRNYNSVTNRSRGETGKPVFKFTNREALEKLGMSADKFSRAKDELEKKGFIEWVVRGGLKGSNGVASQFALSGRWKEWKPGVDEAEKRARAVSNLKASQKKRGPSPWQES